MKEKHKKAKKLVAEADHWTVWPSIFDCPQLEGLPYWLGTNDDCELLPQTKRIAIKGGREWEETVATPGYFRWKRNPKHGVRTRKPDLYGVHNLLLPKQGTPYGVQIPSERIAWRNPDVTGRTPFLIVFICYDVPSEEHVGAGVYTYDTQRWKPDGIWTFRSTLPLRVLIRNAWGIRNYAPTNFTVIPANPPSAEYLPFERVKWGDSDADAEPSFVMPASSPEIDIIEWTRRHYNQYDQRDLSLLRQRLPEIDISVPLSMQMTEWYALLICYICLGYNINLRENRYDGWRARTL